MNYTTPEEVLTFLPRKTKESESKADLIGYIIRGYQQLEIPQDKAYIETLVQPMGHNYEIPDDWNYIVSINLVSQIDDTYQDQYYQYIPVYPTNLHSKLCKDKRRCNNCQLQYSIQDRTLRLPEKDKSYHVVYSQLFSNELKILKDPVIINYLVAYCNYQASYNNVSYNSNTQLLQLDLQQMNTTYAKARGQAIMKAIKLENQRLDTRPINLTIDELSNRFPAP